MGKETMPSVKLYCVWLRSRAYMRGKKQYSKTVLNIDAILLSHFKTIHSVKFKQTIIRSSNCVKTSLKGIQNHGKNMTLLAKCLICFCLTEAVLLCVFKLQTPWPDSIRLFLLSNCLHDKSLIAKLSHCCASRMSLLWPVLHHASIKYYFVKQLKCPKVLLKTPA